VDLSASVAMPMALRVAQGTPAMVGKIHERKVAAPSLVRDHGTTHHHQWSPANQSRSVLGL